MVDLQAEYTHRVEAYHSAGTVFPTTVWIGARHSVIKETHESTQSHHNGQKRNDNVKAGASAGIAQGSMTAAMGRSKKKSSELGQHLEFEKARVHEFALSGDESKKHEYVIKRRTAPQILTYLFIS